MGAHFTIWKTGEYQQTILTEMGHSQVDTPLTTEKSAACGVMNWTIKQKSYR